MSFLRNSAILLCGTLRRASFSADSQLAGGLLFRFLFGVVVASTLSLQVPFHDQPHPVGLAHFFDLTWLSDPEIIGYRGVLYLLLLVYASGWFLPIVLPLLTRSPTA